MAGEAVTAQLEMPGMNAWSCDLCHDKGRIHEYWGKTEGSLYHCPNKCPQVKWSIGDTESEYAHVIKHPAKRR